MKNKFYITTAILYTNGPPHIGFAMELIQADVLARYNRLIGNDVWFLTGTDEHGTTVARAAEKYGKTPIELADEMSGLAKDLILKLNITNDDFIRTSDQVRHWPSVIKLWNKLVENGDLYKKEYEGLYCVGHEAFIKKSDLVDDLCPLHKTVPENIKEENWFFKLTKYKKEIRKRIESDDFKIVPETKSKELLNLLDDAEDVSFSRPATTLKWGIPVPGDETQTMYVWADALTNYISALDYKDEGEKFEKFWPADVHLVGKDILRFHAMIWPAMLLSLGIELPKAIYVHGFINVEGQKMSKTIGNVIDPFGVVAKYGTDVVRYFLLREIPSEEDGDFSYKKLEERYNGDLANGLGNLVQRVATPIETGLDGELVYKKENLLSGVPEFSKEEFGKHIESFKLHDALGYIWKCIGDANVLVNDRKPWKEVKENPKEFLKTITTLVKMIHEIVWMLQPFMPETSQKIAAKFGSDLLNKKVPENYKFIVKKGGGLFPRM